MAIVGDEDNPRGIRVGDMVIRNSDALASLWGSNPPRKVVILEGVDMAVEGVSGWWMPEFFTKIQVPDKKVEDWL